MYTQEPWNEKLPYTFNPSNANLTEKLGEVEKAFIINGIFPGPSSNLLESIVEGHYGANQETTNLNTGQIERRHFDIGNTLVNLDLEGVVDTVNLKIVNSNLDVNEKSTESELIDKKKSGKHLITKLRHTFRGTKHEVMMQVASFEQEAL